MKTLLPKIKQKFQNKRFVYAFIILAIIFAAAISTTFAWFLNIKETNGPTVYTSHIQYRFYGLTQDLEDSDNDGDTDEVVSLFENKQEYFDVESQDTTSVNTNDYVPSLNLHINEERNMYFAVVKSDTSVDLDVRLALEIKDYEYNQSGIEYLKVINLSLDSEESKEHYNYQDYYVVQNDGSYQKATGGYSASALYYEFLVMDKNDDGINTTVTADNYQYYFVYDADNDTYYLGNHDGTAYSETATYYKQSQIIDSVVTSDNYRSYWVRQNNAADGKMIVPSYSYDTYTGYSFYVKNTYDLLYTGSYYYKMSNTTLNSITAGDYTGAKRIIDTYIQSKPTNYATAYALSKIDSDSSTAYGVSTNTVFRVSVGRFDYAASANQTGDQQYKFKINLTCAQAGYYGVGTQQATMVYSEADLRNALSTYATGGTIQLGASFVFNGDLVFSRPVNFLVRGQTLSVTGNLIYTYMYSTGSFVTDTSLKGRINVTKNITVDCPYASVKFTGSSAKSEEDSSSGDIFYQGSVTMNSTAQISDAGGLILEKVSFWKTTTAGAVNVDASVLYIQNYTKVTVQAETYVPYLSADGSDVRYITIDNYGTINRISLTTMGIDSKYATYDQATGSLSSYTGNSTPQIYISNWNTLYKVYLPQFARKWIASSSNGTKTYSGNTRIIWQLYVTQDTLGVIANPIKDPFDQTKVVYGDSHIEINRDDEPVTVNDPDVGSNLIVNISNYEKDDLTSYASFFDEYSTLTSISTFQEIIIGFYMAHPEYNPDTVLRMEIICYKDYGFYSNESYSTFKPNAYKTFTSTYMSDFTFLKTYFTNLTYLDMENTNVNYDEYLNGTRVTVSKFDQKIPANAYKGLADLETLTLPQYTSYLSNQFVNNTSVEELTIPSTVTEVTSQAFYGLKYLHIKKSLEAITGFRAANVYATGTSYWSGGWSYVARCIVFFPDQNTLDLYADKSENYNYSSASCLTPWYACHLEATRSEDDPNYFIRPITSTQCELACFVGNYSAGDSLYTEFIGQYTITSIDHHAFFGRIQKTDSNSVIALNVGYAVNEIGAYAFSYCSALSGLTFLGDTTLYTYSITDDSALEYIEGDYVTTAYRSAIVSNSALVYVDLKNLSYFYNNIDTTLTNSSLTDRWNSVIRDNSNLQWIRVGLPETAYAFRGIVRNDGLGALKYLMINDNSDTMKNEYTGAYMDWLYKTYNHTAILIPKSLESYFSIYNKSGHDNDNYVYNNIVVTGSNVDSDVTTDYSAYSTYSYDFDSDDYCFLNSKTGESISMASAKGNPQMKKQIGFFNSEDITDGYDTVYALDSTGGMIMLYYHNDISYDVEEGNSVDFASLFNLGGLNLVGIGNSCFGTDTIVINGDVTFSDSMDYIGRCAFYRLKDGRPINFNGNVTIGASVVERSAFQQAQIHGMLTLTSGNVVSSRRAFYAMTYCTDVSIEGSTYIGYECFRDAENISDVIWDGTVGGYIDGYAFYSCDRLQYMTECGALSIGSYAFAQDKLLLQANFPEATEIKSYAFQYTSALEYFYGDKVEIIYYAAFDNSGVRYFSAESCVVVENYGLNNLQRIVVCKIPSLKIAAGNDAIRRFGETLRYMEVGDWYGSAWHSCFYEFKSTKSIIVLCQNDGVAPEDYTQYTTLGNNNDGNVKCRFFLRSDDSRSYSTANNGNWTRIDTGESYMTKDHNDFYVKMKDTGISDYDEELIQLGAFGYDEMSRYNDIEYIVTLDFENREAEIVACCIDTYYGTTELKDTYVVPDFTFNVGGTTSTYHTINGKPRCYATTNFSSEITTFKFADNMHTVYDYFTSDFSRRSTKNVSIVDFNNITYIGNYAFTMSNYSFSNLTTLINTDQVTFIGNNAFYGCSLISEAIFPATTSIGSNAFRGCASLLRLEADNCKIIKSAAFCQLSKLAYVSAKSCEVLESSAFEQCKGLEVLKLPSVRVAVNYSLNTLGNNLKLIEMGDFYSDASWNWRWYYNSSTIIIICPVDQSFMEGYESYTSKNTGVYDVTCRFILKPSNTTTYSGRDDSTCTRIDTGDLYLTKDHCDFYVKLHDDNTLYRIDDFDYDNKDKYDDIEYIYSVDSTTSSATIVGCCISTIHSDDGTYQVPDFLNIYDVNGYIGKAGEYVNFSTKNILTHAYTTTEIPSSVTRFRFPDSMEILPTNFKDKFTYRAGKNFTTFDLNHITTVQDQALNGLTNFDTLIGNDVTEIGASAFSQCTSLKYAYFNSCETVGNSAFYNNVNLTTITLPVATDIGTYAFYASALTEIELPEATHIGSNAFRYNNKMKSFVADKVTVFDSDSVRECSSLQYVSAKSAQILNSCAFYYNQSLIVVKMPSLMVVVNDAMRYWGDNLRYVEVGDFRGNWDTNYWYNYSTNAIIVVCPVTGDIPSAYSSYNTRPHQDGNNSGAQCRFCLRPDSTTTWNSKNGTYWTRIDTGDYSISYNSADNTYNQVDYYVKLVNDNNIYKINEFDENQLDKYSQFEYIYAIDKNGDAILLACCIDTITGDEGNDHVFTIKDFNDMVDVSGYVSSIKNKEWDLTTVDVKPRAYTTTLFPASIDTFRLNDSMKTTPENLFNNMSLRAGKNFSIIDLNNAETISTSSFSSQTFFTQVIGNNVTSIQDSAFYKCTGLRTITLPVVKTIGNNAFESSGLTEINLPEAVTIGNYSFRYAPVQTAIMDKVTEIGQEAFRSCTSLTYVSAKLCEVVKSGAFGYCSAMKVFKLPSLKAAVGDWSLRFYSSTLYYCELGDFVSNSNTTFWYNYSATTIIVICPVTGDVPSEYSGYTTRQYEGNDGNIKCGFCLRPTSTKTYSSRNDSNWTRIDTGNYYINATTCQYYCTLKNDATNTLYKLNEFGVEDQEKYSQIEYIFTTDGAEARILACCITTVNGDASNKGVYTIPDFNVYDVNGYFGNTKTQITFPTTDCALRAFSNTSFDKNITTLRFPDSYTSICENFDNNFSLRSTKSFTTLDLNNVTEVGNSAFYSSIITYCPNIIGNNVETIGSSSFRGFAVVNLTLPKVKTIGDYAFYSCSALKSVELASATKLGQETFRNCTALEWFNAPNLVGIGTCCFYYDTSFVVFKAPKLMAIGNQALRNLGTNVRYMEVGAFYVAGSYWDISLYSSDCILVITESQTDLPTDYSTFNNNRWNDTESFRTRFLLYSSSHTSRNSGFFANNGSYCRRVDTGKYYEGYDENGNVHHDYLVKLEGDTNAYYLSTLNQEQYASIEYIYVYDSAYQPIEGADYTSGIVIIAYYKKSIVGSSTNNSTYAIPSSFKDMSGMDRDTVGVLANAYCMTSISNLDIFRIPSTIQYLTGNFFSYYSSSLYDTTKTFTTLDLGSVIYIGDYVFNGGDGNNRSHVTFTNVYAYRVRSLGNYCFNYSNLQYIYLYDILNGDGRYCFNYCNYLKEVYLGEDLTEMYYGMFSNISGTTFKVYLQNEKQMVRVYSGAADNNRFPFISTSYSIVSIYVPSNLLDEYQSYGTNGGIYNMFNYSSASEERKNRFIAAESTYRQNLIGESYLLYYYSNYYEGVKVNNIVFVPAADASFGDYTVDLLDKINSLNVYAIDPKALDFLASMSSISTSITVDLPVNLINSGFASSDGVKYIKAYTISSAATTFRVRDGVVYTTDYTTLISYPGKKEGSTLTISADSEVEMIYSYALNSSSYLQNIVVNKNVQFMQNSIYHCDELLSLTFNSTEGYSEFFGDPVLEFSTARDVNKDFHIVVSDTTLISGYTEHIYEDVQLYNYFTNNSYTLAFYDGENIVKTLTYYDLDSLIDLSVLDPSFDYSTLTVTLYRGWKISNDSETLLSNTTKLSDVYNETTGKYCVYASSSSFCFRNEDGSLPDMKKSVFQKTYVTGNTTIRFPAVTNSGYTLAGWYDETDTSKTILTDETTINFNIDHTFIASYSANTYTVTFDSNVEGQDVTQASIKTGEYLDKLEVSRTGYTFDNWYYEGTDKAFDFSTPFHDAADITLTAKWTINSYTVTVITINDDGTQTTEESIQVEYNSTIPDSYFTGLDVEGFTSEYYTSDALDEEHLFVKSTPITDNTTLYRKKNRNSYSVYVYDGSLLIATLTVKYQSAISDDDFTSLETEGYTTTYYTDSEYTEGTEFDRTTLITENTTIYRRRVINKFTVTLYKVVKNADGDYVVDESSKVELTDVPWGTAPTYPSEEGYQRKYFTDSACTDESAFDTSTLIKEDTTLYYYMVPNSLHVTIKLVNDSHEIVTGYDFNFEVSYDEALTEDNLASMDKTGYTTKYYYDQDCTNEFDPSTTIKTDNLVLYRYYAINSYTVTFYSVDIDTETMKEVITDLETPQSVYYQGKIDKSKLPTYDSDEYVAHYFLLDFDTQSAQQIDLDTYVVEGDVSIYRYLVEIVKISYYADSELVYTQSVEYGTTASAYEDVEKDGFILDHWSTSSDDDVAMDWTKTIIEDISLYAIWRNKTYTIVFVVKDSTYEKTDVVFNKLVEFTSEDLYWEKTGYTYDFYTSNDYDSDNKIDITKYYGPSTYSERVFIYVNMMKTPYDVTFHYEDGTTKTTRYEYGTDLTSTIRDREDPAYNYSYYSNSEHTIVLANFVVSSDMDIYITKEIKTFTITLYDQDGIQLDNPYTVTYGDTITAWLNGFETETSKYDYSYYYIVEDKHVSFTKTAEIKSDYTLYQEKSLRKFTVIITDENGNTTPYYVSYGNMIPSSVAPESTTGYDYFYYTDENKTIRFDLTTKINADLDLWREKKIQTFTVTLKDMDGNVIEGMEITVEYNKAIGLEASKIWDVQGYNSYFYTDKQGTTSFDPKTDKITANIDVYRKLVKLYTVTYYDSDKVTIFTAGTTIVEDGTKIAAAYDPDKNGYNFVQWHYFTDDTVFDISQPITSDVNVYGEFTPKKYTITMMLNSVRQAYFTATFGEKVDFSTHLEWMADGYTYSYSVDGVGINIDNYSGPTTYGDITVVISIKTVRVIIQEESVSYSVTVIVDYGKAIDSSYLPDSGTGCTYKYYTYDKNNVKKLFNKESGIKEFTKIFRETTPDSFDVTIHNYDGTTLTWNVEYGTDIETRLYGLEDSHYNYTYKQGTEGSLVDIDDFHILEAKEIWITREKKTYTVTVLDPEDSSYKKEFSVKYDESITADEYNELKVDGYNVYFYTKYQDSTFTGNIDLASYPISESITIYRKKVRLITVQFHDFTGEVVSEATSIVEDGTVITYPYTLTTTIPAGYNFDHWALDAIDGSVAMDWKNAITVSLADASYVLNLYPVKIGKEITVHFMLDNKVIEGADFTTLFTSGTETIDITSYLTSWNQSCYTYAYYPGDSSMSSSSLATDLTQIQLPATYALDFYIYVKILTVDVTLHYEDTTKESITKTGNNGTKFSDNTSFATFFATYPDYKRVYQYYYYDASHNKVYITSDSVINRYCNDVYQESIVATYTVTVYANSVKLGYAIVEADKTVGEATSVVYEDGVDEEVKTLGLFADGNYYYSYSYFTDLSKLTSEFNVATGTIKSNLTLYRKQSPKPFTVTVLDYSGEHTQVATLTVLYDSYISSEQAASLEDTENYHMYFYLSLDSDTAVTLTTIQVKDHMTIYRKAVKLYVVTYTDGFADTPTAGNCGTQKFEDGQKIMYKDLVFTTPTRTGYGLAGWSTGTTGVNLIAGLNSDKYDLTNVTSTQTYFIVTGDVEFNAIWAAKNYNVYIIKYGEQLWKMQFTYGMADGSYNLSGYERIFKAVGYKYEYYLEDPDFDSDKKITLAGFQGSTDGNDVHIYVKPVISPVTIVNSDGDPQISFYVSYGSPVTKTQIAAFEEVGYTYTYYFGKKKFVIGTTLVTDGIELTYTRKVATYKLYVYCENCHDWYKEGDEYDYGSSLKYGEDLDVYCYNDEWMTSNDVFLYHVDTGYIGIQGQPATPIDFDTFEITSDTILVLSRTHWSHEVNLTLPAGFNP